MTELNEGTGASPPSSGDERWFDDRGDDVVDERVRSAAVGSDRRHEVADDEARVLPSAAQPRQTASDRSARGGTPEVEASSSDGVGRSNERVVRAARPRPSALGLVREYTGLIVGALIIATLIRTFLGLAFYIPSGSMIPTLEIGDRVVVSRLSYAWGEPKRGQVVVFENPTYEGDDGVFLVRWGRHLLGTVGVAQPRDKYFIKRVIGLPGEKISFVEGKVHINGVVLAEPWLEPGVVSDALGETSFDIPAGHVFMMGDNRTNSTDGRVFGPVSEGRIVGRAVVKVWPPGRWGSL